jgi:leader peptidase (prepilin peptidase)/N-methyltransferase
MIFYPELAAALVLLIGVMGLIIGSFLNVVVWRVPRGESLSSPASHCPKCDHPIRWWDNLPVVSWVVLRGRCRDCGEPISARYPLVELATGAIFAVVAWWVLTTPLPELVEGGTVSTSSTSIARIVTLAAFLYLAAISIALTLIDLDTHKLPNRIVLPAYVVGIVLLATASLVVADFDSLIRAGIGMAAMFVAYFLMALAYPGGMGFGDVKLAGVLGLFLAWLGWGELLVGAFAAFVLGGVFSIILLVLRRVGRKSGIPFGPWMLGGAWVGILLGDIIWTGYLSLFGLG